MGHSGIIGWNSDPRRPYQDAPENSWATGTNRAVHSLYRRILARNPAIEGHAYNVARSGSAVDDLARQARVVVALPVPPELVVVQSIDNDMRCDGTDPQNYGPFGRTLARALAIIVRKYPDVRFFFVDQWATPRNFAEVGGKIAGVRAELKRAGPCRLLDSAGKLRPAGVFSYERIVAGYYAQITAVCSRLPHCTTDRAAVHHMKIVRADLASDGHHLSVRGLRKMAAVAWKALS